MFSQFFTNNHQRNLCQHIILTEKQQNQRHTIVFNVEKDIECFNIKPFTENINSIKTCDYVLINHTDRKILFCELKNAKDKNNAIAQLWNSKNIVDCLIKILDNDIEYKQGYVVINKKFLNKGKTRKKMKRISSRHFKYTYTGATSINFENLNYA